MFVGSLHRLFVGVCEQELIPENWRKGITIPIYKDKDCRTECGSYRGITLLSVPGKVCARFLLDRTQKLLHGKRRTEQGGFPPGRSTKDRILTLNSIAQRRREYRKPLYAAYVDLKAAFDSVYRPV